MNAMFALQLSRNFFHQPTPMSASDTMLVLGFMFCCYFYTAVSLKMFSDIERALARRN